MSLKLGTQDISGISQNTKYNAHHLLDFKWSDCIMNDVSWLRADTFSWQSGDVYVSAYNHLVADLQGTTAETETIGSYTVTFYRADDGHKICLADQEATVLNIYNESGIAWYYIIDTVNTQFKLPRTKFGFEGLRGYVGDNIAESLPNIKGTFGLSGAWDITGSGTYSYGTPPSGVFKTIYQAAHFTGGHNSNASGTGAIDFNASRYSSTYQDNAPVQEQATQMYLYFYVGEFTQTATEQTAGLNSELFNGKADTDLSNTIPAASFATTLNNAGIRTVTQTYVNGASWYRIYSDKWCEQGGKVGNNTTTSEQTVNLLKPYTNTNYSVQVTGMNNSDGSWGYGYISTASQIKVGSRGTAGWKGGVFWMTCGYIN